MSKCRIPLGARPMAPTQTPSNRNGAPAAGLNAPWLANAPCSARTIATRTAAVARDSTESDLQQSRLVTPLRSQRARVGKTQKRRKKASSLLAQQLQALQGLALAPGQRFAGARSLGLGLRSRRPRLAPANGWAACRIGGGARRLVVAIMGDVVVVDVLCPLAQVLQVVGLPDLVKGGVPAENVAQWLLELEGP